MKEKDIDALLKNAWWLLWKPEMFLENLTVLIQVVRFQRTKRIYDEVLFRTIALGNKYIRW